MNKRTAEALSQLNTNVAHAFDVVGKRLTISHHPQLPREAVAGVEQIVQSMVRDIRDAVEGIELARAELDAALREADVSWKLRAIRAITEAE